MPVACGNTVLTGSSGSIAFKPSGTSVCLEDHDDFPAGTLITMPEGHGFVVGDQIEFTEEDGASLDTALDQPHYFVVARTNASISVSATAGGAAVTLNGDGGTGTANTPAPAHINVALSEFTSVCHVESFDLSLDRDQIETTSLSCGCSTDANAEVLAPFKTYQAGFIEGTGSMVVQFTEDQGTMASRLLGSSLRKNQDGAEVRLYINTVCAAGHIDNDASAYIEAPISILGFSFSVSPEEVTTATLNFALSGQPTAFTI